MVIIKPKQRIDEYGAVSEQSCRHEFFKRIMSVPYKTGKKKVINTHRKIVPYCAVHVMILDLFLLDRIFDLTILTGSGHGCRGNFSNTSSIFYLGEKIKRKKC